MIDIQQLTSLISAFRVETKDELKVVVKNGNKKIPHTFGHEGIVIDLQEN